MSVQRTPPESAKRALSLISPENTIEPKRIMSGGLDATVGNMPTKELLEAFSTLLDGKLEHLASKDDIRSLQQEIDDVKNECEALKQEVKALNYNNAQLKRKLDAHERQQKAGNLIFRGLPDNDAHPSETIQKFCKEILGIEDKINIRSASRVGRTMPNRTRPILVEYLSLEDTKTVMDRAASLKNTKFVVHRDRTEAARKKRSLLYEIKSAINQRNKDIKVEIRGHQLSVNKKFFTCNEDNQLVTRNGDAIEELTKLIGVDAGFILVEAVDNLKRKRQHKFGEMVDVVNLASEVQSDA